MQARMGAEKKKKRRVKPWWTRAVHIFSYFIFFPSFFIRVRDGILVRGSRHASLVGIAGVFETASTSHPRHRVPNLVCPCRLLMAEGTRERGLAASMRTRVPGLTGIQSGAANQSAGTF